MNFESQNFELSKVDQPKKNENEDDPKTGIEKKDDNKENKKENPEELKRYLADKFVEIFNKQISEPDPIAESIMGKPDFNNPLIKQLYINSSLQELCKDPRIDPKTSERIRLSIMSSGMGMIMDETPYQDLNEMRAMESKLALYSLIAGLEDIFPLDVVEMIKKQI